MYRLDAKQQAVVEKAAKVADASIAPHAAEVDKNGSFPRAALEALGAAGLLGVNVPVAYGGLGEGLRTMCAVLDQVAQRCPSTAMIYKMHLCAIANYAAAPTPPAEQLKAAAAGKHLATLAWSEKGSRSHFWAPMSQAVVANGGVTVSAEKSWVTSAGEADSYSVSTRWSEAKQPTDTMLYMVLKGDPGVSIAGPWDGMGMRGNASAPMRLEDTPLAASRALCADGKGFETMLGVVLPVFNLGNAAVSVGIAEAACAATQKHLTGSRFGHLGSPLSDLPTLRARLARMRIETDKARAHLACAVDSIENPGPATTLLVLESKAQASETAIAVTDDAMRACGGAAFSKHLDLDRYFRDARAGAVMAPTSDVIQEFIGRALCGMELF
ncbi:MAG: acyl-CoA dehydrogenase family protein [Planctomycetota bacterium]